MCLESGGSFRKSQREEGIQEEAGIRAKQEERQRGQLLPLSPTPFPLVFGVISKVGRDGE